MIILGKCSGPAFLKRSALREPIEACGIIITGTWLPRERVDPRRLTGYDLAMRATPDDCRGPGLWEGGNAEFSLTTPSQAARMDLQEITCPDCATVCFGANALQDHVTSEHTDGLHCSECTFVTKDPGKLTEHMKRMHSGIYRRRPCTEPGCDKVLTSKSILATHVLRMHNPLAEEKSCPFDG